MTGPCDIQRGDTYSIRNSGTVFKAEADHFLQRIFRVGSPGSDFPFFTLDHDADRAELFALPHPYFAESLR